MNTEKLKAERIRAREKAALWQARVRLCPPGLSQSPPPPFFAFSLTSLTNEQEGCCADSLLPGVGNFLYLYD